MNKLTKTSATQATNGSVYKIPNYSGEEVVELSRKYIAEGVLPAGKIEDSMHAAVATVFEMDTLISWNLRHLANFKKMEMINGVNMKEGYYKRLELLTPMEVSDEEL